jgi:Fe-S-cluster containining protein
MIIKKENQPLGTKESCKCDKCKAACIRKPGWFLPGEAEKAAEYLGISLDELFRTKLAVDWWQGTPNIFVLSPAIIGERRGVEFPASPLGPCVFFKNELCEIHPVKPYECRDMLHNNPEGNKHELTGKAWGPYQNQIEELLGRKPEAKKYSFFDYLDDMPKPPRG